MVTVLFNGVWHQTGLTIFTVGAGEAGRAGTEGTPHQLDAAAAILTGVGVTGERGSAWRAHVQQDMEVTKGYKGYQLGVTRATRGC